MLVVVVVLYVIVVAVVLYVVVVAVVLVVVTAVESFKDSKITNKIKNGEVRCERRVFREKFTSLCANHRKPL